MAASERWAQEPFLGATPGHAPNNMREEELEVALKVSK